MIRQLITYEVNCDKCGRVEQLVSKHEMPLPPEWQRKQKKVGFNRLRRKPIYRRLDLCPQCSKQWNDAEIKAAAEEKVAIQTKLASIPKEVMAQLLRTDKEQKKDSGGINHE